MRADVRLVIAHGAPQIGIGRAAACEQRAIGWIDWLILAKVFGPIAVVDNLAVLAGKDVF